MSGRSRCRAILGSLALILTGGLDAAEPLVQHAQSALIEIPVHVTRNGEPVRGLTADDFIVREDGQPTEIKGFTVLDLTTSAGTPDVAPVPPQISIAARRHFLLLFDLSFSSAQSIDRARKTLREWVGGALHPWDLVGVATYSASKGARLVLNFTTDRDEVALAIDSLGAPHLIDRSLDPLGLEISAPGTYGSLEDDPAPTTIGNQSNRLAAEQQSVDALSQIFYSVYDPIMRQGQRHQVTDFTDSISRLVQVMRQVTGRKTVVYLSEGFDSELMFASSDPQDIARLNEDISHGQFWTVDEERRFGSVVTQESMANLVEEFRRADCVIEAIDVAGNVDATESKSFSSRGADTLFFLANETGGEFYRNYNKIDQALTRLLHKTTLTYLIGIQPRSLVRDGKYHPLKVKLRKKRRGIRIDHRPGYFAPADDSSTAVADQRMVSAQRIMDGRVGGSMEPAVLAVPIRGESEKTRVAVLVEIDRGSIPAPPPGQTLALEVYAYAFGPSGRVDDFITQRLTLDAPTVETTLRTGGVKFFGEMDLPVGSHSLRVMVREERTGAWGVSIAPVEIPPFDESRPTLLPPFFPDPRGKWLLAREPSLAGATDRPFPFMHGDEPFLPAARPIVDADRESRILLLAYDLPQGALEVSAEILDRSGRVQPPPEVALLERDSSPPSGKDVLLVRFNPDGLAAGAYTLRVRLGPQGKSETPVGTVAFEVRKSQRATDALR